MKFITICVTICAIALLSFDFVNPQVHRATIANTFLNQNYDDQHAFSPVHAENYFIRHPHVRSGEGSRRVNVIRGNQKFPLPTFEDVDVNRGTQNPLATFEDELYLHFDISETRIVNSWVTCAEKKHVWRFGGLDLFKNDKQTPLSYAKERKCLVDCAMRKLGVITDAGLNETEYMLHIKQLRLNYTSFDINEKSNETKQTILNTIRNGTRRFAAQDDCYIIFDPSRWFGKETISKIDLCYELIESYALAAHNCKDLKDPAGDNCETSWMILTCMNEDHRKRHFKGPFFPIPLTERAYDASKSAVNSTGLD